MSSKYDGWQGDELRTELQRRGLSTTGLDTDLRARLVVNDRDMYRIIRHQNRNIDGAPGTATVSGFGNGAVTVVEEESDFSLFPRFPPELREMIWLETFQDDRIVVQGLGNMDTKKNTNPVALFVCVESRAIARKHYQVLFGTLVYIDFSRDELRIQPRATVFRHRWEYEEDVLNFQTWYLAKSRKFPEIGNQFRTVQFLSLSPALAKLLLDDENTMSELSKLKTLTIVLDSSCRDYYSLLTFHYIKTQCPADYETALITRRGQRDRAFLESNAWEDNQFADWFEFYCVGTVLEDWAKFNIARIAAASARFCENYGRHPEIDFVYYGQPSEYKLEEIDPKLQGRYGVNHQDLSDRYGDNAFYEKVEFIYPDGYKGQRAGYYTPAPGNHNKGCIRMIRCGVIE